MMKAKISCIGSGNMGFALMKGAASLVNPELIGFSDAEKSKAKEAAASLGGIFYSSNSEAIRNGDFIFLAVKPQVLESVLKEIAPIVMKKLNEKTGKDLVIISMAAGWSIEKIQSHLGSKVPVARIMPNTPALISRGVIALSSSAEFPEDKIAELKKILSGAGLVDRVEERLLDAVTGLSGSGPAFACLFIEALADGGVRAGLPRDKALLYAAQTVMGSAAMLLETGKHPAELKDMVTSPGGTTIAGLSALENGAFRAAAINAVEAAWRRAEELGKH